MSLIRDHHSLISDVAKRNPPPANSKLKKEIGNCGYTLEPLLFLKMYDTSVFVYGETFEETVDTSRVCDAQLEAR